MEAAKLLEERRKRERHLEFWKGTQNYFQNFEKKNTKYEAWTSPRYYEDNSKVIAKAQSEKEKQLKLEKRREKMLKLYQEEARSFDIEMAIVKTQHFGKNVNSKNDDIPTEILKELNVSLKVDEDMKRRKEAEMKMYHQWRINNPVVRQIENKYMSKNLKLSWLDQQIEKQMKKEQEQEECRRIIRETEERLRLQKEEEERNLRYNKEKQKSLKEFLEKQIEELHKKNRESEILKAQESEELKKKLEIEEIKEKYRKNVEVMSQREIALSNLKLHKMKLKQKCLDIQKNLLQEKEFILKLKQLHLESILENEQKRIEIKNSLDEFCDLLKQQHELEIRRQKCLEFIFDSEAKSIYEKQNNIWKSEESNRKKLVEEVFKCLEHQIASKIDSNKEKQKEILREKEAMVAMMEQYNEELKRMEQEEQNAKIQKKKCLEDEIKLKNARKKQQESLKLKEIDDELERIRNEEQRLKDEIIRIQKRQGPGSQISRSRLFF